mmetsp:Transcript_2935/g.3905  ORF Transcript_2935/g.3905 Transcript_2935/m.3905 type:complete len:102 (+) Transcript_2935:511-816(+)
MIVTMIAMMNIMMIEANQEREEVDQEGEGTDRGVDADQGAELDKGVEVDQSEAETDQRGVLADVQKEIMIIQRTIIVMNLFFFVAMNLVVLTNLVVMTTSS